MGLATIEARGSDGVAELCNPWRLQLEDFYEIETLFAQY